MATSRKVMIQMGNNLFSSTPAALFKSLGRAVVHSRRLTLGAAHGQPHTGPRHS